MRHEEDMNVSTALRSLRRAALWHRRGLSALAAAVCVLAVVAAVRPPAPRLVTVVVTARAVDAGTKLAAADLTTADLPASAVPDLAVTDTDDVLGATLVGALTRGSVLTASSTVDAGRGVPAGQRLVPFRMHDATVLGLLRVGDRVTVVATNDGSMVTLAKQVRVAAIPQSGDSGGVLGGSTESGGMVLLACDPATAEVLAAWSGSASVGIALG